ncbi:MAG: hypothetical protein J6T49_01660, partial [Bacteroidales bacterium]|nr:hypothetical protein [Bacteroidales bacterium]
KTEEFVATGGRSVSRRPSVFVPSEPLVAGWAKSASGDSLTYFAYVRKIVTAERNESESRGSGVFVFIFVLDYERYDRHKNAFFSHEEARQ